MPDHSYEVRLDVEESSVYGGLSRKELLRGEVSRVDLYSGSVKKTIPARLRIPADAYALFVVREGAALLWSEPDRRWFVIPPQSVTYIRGPIALSMSFARGNHRVEVVSWGAKSTPFLNDWLDRQRVKGPEGDRPRVMATRPYNPMFKSTLDRFDEACKQQPEIMEPLIISVMYELLPKLVRTRSKVGLAPIPPDLPDNIERLIAEVRQKPDVAWPLKDAADFVGYSPFHFSRVFKSIIGYGFHEFVDRCRTEHAVDMLCTTDLPIDVVSAAAGFGTTQALRESVKEYLGLVPSELRSNPEELSSR